MVQHPNIYIYAYICLCSIHLCINIFIYIYTVHIIYHILILHNIDLHIHNVPFKLSMSMNNLLREFSFQKT